MIAQVPPQLLNRPAHLLFHASHAQSRLFRDFGVTIAIKAASEKYLPGQRLEAQDGLFDTGKTVARLQRGFGEQMAMLQSAEADLLDDADDAEEDT